MVRTFETHKIRECTELTGKYWDFEALTGELKGERRKVFTPASWETLPGFGNYRGEALFTTTFTGGGNLRIECKGVSHTATLYVDGEEKAGHYNAYTPFEVVLTGISEGEHRLTVKADNRFSEASALHIPNDYMSYGGVTRPVVLERLEDVYIKGIKVTTTRRAGVWRAEASVTVLNISKEQKRISLTLELAGKTVSFPETEVGAGEAYTFTTVESFEGVEAWEPETPALYYVTATLFICTKAIDDLTDRFGFREVSIEGKKICLNGKPVYIKGLCRHEDHPQYGCALPVEAMAADLEIFKDLGANSVRTSHYPNDERFLDLCDELGILVWEENHARGLSEENMRNPNFEPQAEQVIREMIPLHYNHPSIYIWGILNECASETEYGRECYKKQIELIKSLDSTRPVSFASCKFKTDISFGLPDVVSYNIYPLWYHNTPVDEYLSDLYDWVQNDTEGKGKPFLITEIGAGGLYGYRNPYHAKWTEDYQAEALYKQLKAVMEFDDCTGVYIWQFCDVRVSDEWWGGRPRTMNNKGVVDEYRRPKLCYETVKEAFKRRGQALYKEELNEQKGTYNT